MPVPPIAAVPRNYALLECLTLQIHRNPTLVHRAAVEEQLVQIAVEVAGPLARFPEALLVLLRQCTHVDRLLVGEELSTQQVSEMFSAVSGKTDPLLRCLVRGILKTSSVSCC